MAKQNSCNTIIRVHSTTLIMVLQRVCVWGRGGDLNLVHTPCHDLVKGY